MRMCTVIICLLFALSCKKSNDDGPSEPAIARQFMNNILISERTYGADGKLAREQSYNEQTGLVSYAIEFEYDSYGRLLKEKQYNSSNKLSAIVSYYWAPNGRLEKHEYLIMNGVDSGKITVRVRYGYNAEGRIAKQSWVDLVTDQVYDSREMSYYNNNNLKSVVGYSHYGGAPDLKYRLDYSPEGDSLLPGLANRGGYIIDFRLPDFVADKQYYHYYDGAIVTTEINTLYTNRQYNDKGYLKSQRVTLKKIKPAGADVVDEFRYEYIELKKP